MADFSSIKRRATYEDLRRVPDHFVAEILDGELLTTPRPALPHALAGVVLVADLNIAFQQGRGGPGGWWILYEPELHLGPDVVVPDLAGWKRDRVPTLPREAAMVEPPDWVCEIVSPATEATDRTRKLSLYARHSVNHAWLVNPLSQTLEVLRLEDGRWVLIATHAGDETVRAEPFEVLALELFRVWGRSQPGDASG